MVVVFTDFERTYQRHGTFSGFFPMGSMEQHRQKQNKLPILVEVGRMPDVMRTVERL
jgi:hypothetical protein